MSIPDDPKPEPKRPSSKVQLRQQEFAERIPTQIWQEEPTENNPFLAKTHRCHGYELFELMHKRSFVDVLFLLFRGELPNPAQTELLESLMIALISPGPRHNATRSAMQAGISKTDVTMLLPISLSVLSGEHNGAGIIEQCFVFFNDHRNEDATKVAKHFTQQLPEHHEGDVCIAPGFGSLYGEADPVAARLAFELLELEAAGDRLRWGQAFAQHVSEYNQGWYTCGIAAAVLNDLGFHPRAAAGLFQIFSAPGLLAHGVEMTGNPMNAMPFMKDSQYEILPE